MAGLHFDITGDNSNFLRKLEETRNGVRFASNQIEESGMSIEQMFGRLSKGAALFGAGFSASQFIKDMINVRGEFQKTQMAFETMLGSKEKADTLMTQMVQTAAKTPFDLQGVANSFTKGMPRPINCRTS
nr:MAG TPA: Tape measure domain protein [Caudoviricetes sp.]